MKTRLFFISILSAFAVNASAFSGTGGGTPDSPYIITTAEQLNEARNDLSASYRLGADIDLTAWIDANSPVAGWEPVGFGTLTDPHPFTGNFDGNGHFITGLWINRPDNDYIGLFGQVTGVVSFRNLGVKTAEGKSIKGKESVGGIAGWLTNIETTNTALFSNCCVIGDIEGAKNVGAIIGLNNWVHPTLENCYAGGSIKSTGDGAGGLLGSTWGNTNIDIKKCYAFNSVEAAASGSAGGILGSASANSPQNIYISISYSGAFNPTIDAGTGNRIICYTKSGANVTLASNWGFELTLVNGWDIWDDCLPDNKEGLSITAAQLKDAATYTEWDFPSVWTMGNENYPLPVLTSLSKVHQPQTAPSHIATAIKTVDNDAFTVYPNPAKGEIFVKNKPFGASVEIYDRSGRLLSKNKDDIQDISSLNQGIYFVKVEQRIAKIIKQ
jgi:hypothetical protein